MTQSIGYAIFAFLKEAEECSEHPETIFANKIRAKLITKRSQMGEPIPYERLIEELVTQFYSKDDLRLHFAKAAIHMLRKQGIDMTQVFNLLELQLTANQSRTA